MPLRTLLAEVTHKAIALVQTQAGFKTQAITLYCHGHSVLADRLVVTIVPAWPRGRTRCLEIPRSPIPVSQQSWPESLMVVAEMVSVASIF